MYALLQLKHWDILYVTVHLLQIELQLLALFPSLLCASPMNAQEVCDSSANSIRLATGLADADSWLKKVSGPGQITAILSEKDPAVE